jgi:hypothetical protein
MAGFVSGSPTAAPGFQEPAPGGALVFNLKKVVPLRPTFFNGKKTENTMPRSPSR